MDVRQNTKKNNDMKYIMQKKSRSTQTFLDE